MRTPLTDISNNDVMSSPAPSTSRRKSGRAVRAPEKFIPDVPSSQAGAASSKRKRARGDVENDASDLEEEEDEEESEDENESAGEEEVRTRRKPKAKPTKKPASKKPRVNGTARHGDDSAPPATVRLTSRPKKAPKARKVAISDDDAEGLYADVFASGDSMKDVVSQWLVRHNQNGPLAVTELVNFVLKAAGCDIEVTEDHINDPDAADGSLADVQAQHQAQNITDYPLISKAKSTHDFRESFVAFFSHLIEVLHESEVLYTEIPLIENIHVWISTMTSSTSRPFRHTATLAGLTMMTAMCKIAQSQVETAAQVRRQSEGEKGKKAVNKARLADFHRKIAAIENRKDFVDAQINDYYTTVYTNRYRDVDARIRLECAEALGNWVSSYSTYFLKEEYLRYMGWMLSDVHAPMRQEVVKQIFQIMKVEANHGSMRHFIERFRPRIIEIAVKDSEQSVRASAILLADSIRQAGFLEPDDIDSIGRLIFDSEPKVRKALVNFFAENVKDLYESKVDELGGEEALEDVFVEDSDDFDSLRPEWTNYKCLAEILSSYDGENEDELPSQIQGIKYLNVTRTESRFTLAAQALYHKVPGLKDWESLAGYLLFDHTSQATGSEAEQALRAAVAPTEREECIMLDVLSSAVKTTMKQLEDNMHDRGAKKTGRAEASEEMEVAARHLATLIPRLLKKFGPDPRTAAVVLRLEHVLNFGLYEELRQDSTEFAKHLDDITAQFKAHADDTVLKEAGAVFLRAREFEELEEITESTLQSLWDDTMISLRKINAAGEISARGALSTKVLTELAHVLARLAELSSISSSVEYLEAEGPKDGTLPIAIVLDVIARGVYEESNDDVRDMLEDEAVVSAIRAGSFYFMWKIRALLNSINAGEEVADLDIDHLKEWSETFTTNLVAAFSSRSTLDPVRILGAGTYLESHTILYSLWPSQKGKGKEPANKDEYEYLQTLIREIIPQVQLEIASIFEGLEKQYAKLSKKQLAQPGEDEEPEDLEEESDDDDDDTNESERLINTLRAEQQLCELTGKIVLAIVAGAIDGSGSLKGKLRTRIQRNRQKLGNNFKEVLAYLDEPKTKSAKGHRSRAQLAAVAKSNAKSKEVVEEDDESEEEEEEEEVPIVAEDDQPEESVDGASEEGHQDEDEVMGD